MPIKKISPIYRPPPPKPRPPPSTEVRAPQSGQTIASRIIKPVGAAVVLWATLAHAQPTTAPWGGAPANVPATCAALNYLGSATIGCPPYQPPTTGVGDGTGQFTAALAASKVVRVPAGTYPICNLAPQQDNQVLACDGPASAFVPTTGCTNMVLVNSA